MAYTLISTVEHHFYTPFQRKVLLLNMIIRFNMTGLI